jgi:hypothetical protein
MTPATSIYGLMAEFNDADELLAATQHTHNAGYQRIDAYSPFPIDGLGEALGFRRSSISWIVLMGGIIGGVAGFGLQYYVSVIVNPINVGGKPLFSWPAFMPITFETTILGAAVAGVIGMLLLNRLPMPYHPVFNVDSFIQASQDSFFLCIESADSQFDEQGTREFLLSLNPREVYDVPR